MLLALERVVENLMAHQNMLCGRDIRCPKAGIARLVHAERHGVAAGAAGLKAVQDRLDPVRGEGGTSSGGAGSDVGELLAGRAVRILLRGDDALVAGRQVEFDVDAVIDAVGAVGWLQRKWAAPSITPLTIIVTGVEVVAPTQMYASWNPPSLAPRRS
ncbi:hypothetical protein ACFV4K_10865 [Nocardia sp. NPDC059764]|uniref:hypothetical protein n=1 Tax=Nocardia sp. NPDC059764 TaxID=3346939 RepID=UPI0036591D5E